MSIKKLKRTIIQQPSSKEGRDEKGDDTAFHAENGVAKALVAKYRETFPGYDSYVAKIKKGMEEED
jgi:hypothetical protein